MAASAGGIVVLALMAVLMSALTVFVVRACCFRPRWHYTRL